MSSFSGDTVLSTFNMRARYLLVLLFILVAACSSPDPIESSPLAKIRISVGMPRSEVEQLVAKALSSKFTYSAYGNNLKGGLVEYLDGSTVLAVTYNPGAPAPWITTEEGKMKHYPPVDETVAAYRLYSKGSQ